MLAHIFSKAVGDKGRNHECMRVAIGGADRLTADMVDDCIETDFVER